MHEPASEPEERQVLMHPQSSPFAGWFLFITGLALAGAILKAMLSPGAIPWTELVFGGLASALLVSTGRLLRTPKGGLEWNQTHVFVRGCGDSFSLNKESIKHIVCHCRTSSQSDDAIFLWNVEIRTRDGLCVLVGESPHQEEAMMMGRTLAEGLGTTLFEDFEDFSRPSSPERQVKPAFKANYQVVRGAALAIPVTLAGVVSSWAGMAISTGGGGAFSFLVGPPLALLGFALLGAQIFGKLGVHRFEILETSIRTQFQLGPWTLVDKVVSRTEPWFLRIRPDGARGWRMELVGPTGCVPVIGSVRSQSSPIGIEDLLDSSTLLNAGLSHSTDSANAGE